MTPGGIYHHRQFYVDPETRAFRGKYMLVLAAAPGGDLIMRLLTSRPHGRPEQPRCYHGDPYPGFFLGTLGRPLDRPTWLDLRYLEDADSHIAGRDEQNGLIQLVATLQQGLFRAALECAAGANDTTRLQAHSIRDQIAALPG
jgi:hypothetical protein